MNCEGCLLNKGDCCYKIGDKISVFGICEEDERMMEKPCQKHSKLNKYERNKKYKHKLKQIANHPKRYLAGAYYVIDRSCHWNLHQDYYDWIHENGKYVKRCYRANHAPVILVG